MFILKSGDRTLPLVKPLVMGVINLTPDSFYAESRVASSSEWIERIDKMVSEGVDIIDLGGQSSRPGATLIEEDEEYARIAEALDYTLKTHPDIWVSIDTFHAGVARKCLEKGAHIINDISGGNMDENMIPTVAGFDACYVCMHMKGNPENMQMDPRYNDVQQEIMDFFSAKILECKSAGLVNIILDPGFGFGKQLSHNFELVNKLELFQHLGYPILAGFSRKSMIYKFLGSTPAESLNGTIVMNTIALMKGVSILRVHDVKPAREAILLFQEVKK